MGLKGAAGYEEIAHTADWALKAWAPDLVGLLEQAARGMLALMQAEAEPGMRRQAVFSLPLDDEESLLVAFLSELLYEVEQHGLLAERYDLRLENGRLNASVEGGRMTHPGKEIKAVTFSGLKIEHSPRGLTTVIVFDV